MSIISSTIPNLVNGVSQQPYALRLASQAEEQINALSSVVEGLRKRPPSRHVAKIANADLGDAHIHMINRDSVERYVVITTNENIRVFDFLGNEKTVNKPNGVSYLQSLNPKSNFQLLTVADFTFVLNKEKVTARATVKTPSRPFEIMIWVRQGAYSTSYFGSVGGVSFNVQTLDASNAANAVSIKTETIGAGIKAQLEAGGINPANGYTIQQNGSTLYVSHPTTEFQANVSDSVGDTVLKLINRSVQRFTDLPAKAFPGFLVKVAGTNENAFDNYYVEYFNETNNQFGGVWRESAKSAEDNTIDPNQMPHILVREANGTFTFKKADWKLRTVGDLDSVPFPSFVGRKINDVFFFRNRLGFLADENIVFSESGEFFNFFKKSAIQTVDTDMIDVAVSHIKVSILKHAVPFNESLLLFSDQTQFMLGKAELLTPRTTSVNQTTEFEANLTSKPVGAGTNVYFAQTRGAFSGVREYYVDGETETNDAADVTAHCPRYIPGKITRLAATSNEDMLVALSDATPSMIYLYRYYWSKGEKLQSSWSRWELPEGSNILTLEFIESDMYLVIGRPDGTYIEVISLEAGRVDPGGTFAVNLDRRVSQDTATLVVQNVDDTTSITLPYLLDNDQAVEVISWYDCDHCKPGQVIQIAERSVSGGKTVIKTAKPCTKFFVGLPYTFRYRFSTFLVREGAPGGGQQPVGEGRVQVRQLTLTYNQSGYFRTEVTLKNRQTYRYVFSGRVIGSLQNKLGAISIEEGLFKFPVQSKNDQVAIDVINDSFLPCAFLSAEWEGFFVIRSRRM